MADTARFSVPERVRPIRDRVLKFIEEHVYPLESQFPSLSKAERVAVVRDLQQLAKDEGLWALGHPKEIGGQGMPFRDYVYVNEVQGRSELGSVVLGTHSLQDSLMFHRHASETLKKRYLAGIVSADIYPSFAMTEPDIVSSDPTGIETTGKLEGDEWVINGRKWWTSNAAGAAFTSVMVRTEFDASTPIHLSFSIIVVPTSNPGYKIQRSTHVLGVEAVDHSEVVYDNVRVPKDNVLGTRGHGFLIAQQRLGPGRIFHCMRWLGQAQRAFDLMCKRLVDRKLPGGKMLGSNQLMMKHVYDSYCDIQAMRLLTLAAAEKMDLAGESDPQAARVELAAAKAYGAGCLCRVMDRAVQCWGAKGLTEDTPLSAMYRLARAGRFYDGPDEVHISTVGKLLLRQYSRGMRWDFAQAKPTVTPVSKL